jgi:putative acetyltransferase
MGSMQRSPRRPGPRAAVLAGNGRKVPGEPATTTIDATGANATMPVRPGTDADATDAADVVRRVLAEHGLPFDRLRHDADLLAPQAHYAARGGAFYVATDAGGRVVGTAALERTGPASGEVRKMFLLPEARGNGIGRALLDAVLAAARARRLERVSLRTRHRFDRAIRMYERAGFRLVGSALQARDGGPGLVYQLDLGAATPPRPADGRAPGRAAGERGPHRPAGLPRRSLVPTPAA